jgi:hypothetical protein
MKTLNIGTPTIMLPNFKGEIIRETNKQIIVKITDVDFTPKSNNKFTHFFNEHDIDFFIKKIGNELRFWKKNSDFFGEVGGDKFLF